VTAALDELLGGDVWQVARHLLGWHLRTDVAGEPTVVRIVEVEAYAGADDPASHAFSGRTPRNDAMFGGPGVLYVYRSYGIHWCMNVVVGPPGLPHAVLLRAGEPVIGREVMEQRRGRADHLVDGPGKLCQALAVDGSMNRSEVRRGPVRLMPGTRRLGETVAVTPRIGISRAVDMPWRFLLVGRDGRTESESPPVRRGSNLAAHDDES